MFLFHENCLCVFLVLFLLGVHYFYVSICFMNFFLRSACTTSGAGLVGVFPRGLTDQGRPLERFAANF